MQGLCHTGMRFLVQCVNDASVIHVGIVSVRKGMASRPTARCRRNLPRFRAENIQPLAVLRGEELFECSLEIRVTVSYDHENRGNSSSCSLLLIIRQ